MARRKLARRLRHQQHQADRPVGQIERPDQHFAGQSLGDRSDRNGPPLGRVDVAHFPSPAPGQELLEIGG